MFSCPRKVSRPLSAILLTMFFVSIVFPAYSQDDIAALKSVKIVKYFTSGTAASSDTLAPTLFLGPLYTLQRQPDGKLSVLPPSSEYEDALYTEVVLAVLACSVDNDRAEEPISGFISEDLGGNDFEKSRVCNVRKVKGGFGAMFYLEKAPLGPIVVYLGFSDLPKDVKTLEKGKGAVIRLPDGTDILVEVKPLGSAPDDYNVPEKERIAKVQEVIGLVVSGKVQEAVERVLTSFVTSDRSAEAFAAICNKLIGAVRAGRCEPDKARAFFRTVMSSGIELINDKDFSSAVQLMAGQSLTLLSWNERKVEIPQTDVMRLTADKAKMASNDKHGKSFIDKTALPEGISETQKEGAAGFFWRGVEKIAKLGGNVMDRLIHDRNRFNANRDRVVMYLMDHGFFKVPDDLRSATDGGIVSTMHETFFMTDVLPGSFQTTSTGAGHYQENKVDLKRVTEGRGIQFNVKYDESGAIVEVIGQELKPGDWALALPGYVDYVVNLGGLRFNDISIALNDDIAARFCPGFSKEGIAKMKEVIAQKGKIAPYAGARIGGKSYLVKAVDDAPQVRWLPRLKNYPESTLFSDMYTALTSNQVSGFAVTVAQDYAGTLAATAPNAPVETLPAEMPADITPMPAATLGKAGGISEYIREESGALAALASSGNRDMLIRVPVEAIEAAGKQNVTPFLAALQAAPRVYVELFSSVSDQVFQDAKYVEYGVVKKGLPAGFTANKANTVTLMPIAKSDEITARKKEEEGWGIGGMRPTETILSPVGITNDTSGLARGVVLGLRLAEIARQLNSTGQADGGFVRETLERYRAFCVSQGVKEFNVSADDLVNLAANNINRVVEALNRLIKSMPIMPLNAEEIRIIYEHAKEALIRA